MVIDNIRSKIMRICYFIVIFRVKFVILVFGWKLNCGFGDKSLFWELFIIYVVFMVGGSFFENFIV